MIDPNRSTQDLVDSVSKTISHNYAPRPLVIDHGKGMNIVDREGREYLDFVAGIAVCSLGYNHPVLREALQDQVAKILHVSNMFMSEAQVLLQEHLVEHSFADRVYLCNSGTEANEAAIKLARRYQKTVRGQENQTNIVAAMKSFHGRTYASLAATGQPKYWKGFEPLPAGFIHVPYNDTAAFVAAIDEETCAVMLEPVQGEGGLKPGLKTFFEAVRKRCDEVGAVLIFDEVQTGVGRTGTLWAYEHFGVLPDIMTLAKGLGGGVPLGAMLSNEKVAAGFTRGSHASTFGGNPLASRAGLVVMETVNKPAFLKQIKVVGAHLKKALETLMSRHSVIKDVRGMGLMLGAEVGAENAVPIITAARAEGLVINSAGGDTLRFAPPLIATIEDVDKAIACLDRALSSTAAA